MAAALDQMIALLELLLSEVAGHHCSAVAIHAIGEVLASQADSSSLPALQLSHIHKIPFLHSPFYDSTSVLQWRKEERPAQSIHRCAGKSRLHWSLVTSLFAMQSLYCCE